MSFLDILTRKQNRKGLIVLSILCLGLLFLLIKQKQHHFTNQQPQDKGSFFAKVQQQKQLYEQLHNDRTTASSPIIEEKAAVDLDVLPVIYPDPFEFHVPEPYNNKSSHHEKFITYLPHSGFHNQRIELENALLLASYLNRTLLLPSVYLGNPAFPWLRFDKMYERLLLQTKNGLDYCSRMRPGEPVPSECLNYARWTSVPWTFFYDFGQLKQKVRIIFRQDLSLEWIKSSFDVEEEDIYLFKDVSPFDFRVYDLPESKTPLARFVNRIDISTLEAIKERVIHFGSVFGTYRVLAQSIENTELLKFIRQEMIFKNPTLINTASSVVEQLGGVGEFIGIHLRVGDGLFKVRASITVDDIYHQLVNDYTDLTLEEVAEYEEGRHLDDRKENTEYEIKQLRESQQVYVTTEDTLSVKHPADIQSRLGASTLSQLKCQKGDGKNDRFAKTTIFIATDCPEPRNHPLLRKIFKTFPCVFVLSDFKSSLKDLSKVTVVEEGVNLESYLIPMVDAIISSQGHTFFGTNASTFSTYIQRQLHPIYNNKQLEIIGAPMPF
jgi:hypothetical protein